jgi:hypothetical protein
MFELVEYVRVHELTRFICLERDTFDFCVRFAVLCKVAGNVLNQFCPMIFRACHVNFYNQIVSTVRTF